MQYNYDNSDLEGNSNEIMRKNKGIENIREPLPKMKLHDEYAIGFNAGQGI